MWKKNEAKVGFARKKRSLPTTSNLAQQDGIFIKTRNTSVYRSIVQNGSIFCLVFLHKMRRTSIFPSSSYGEH